MRYIYRKVVRLYEMGYEFPEIARKTSLSVEEVTEVINAFNLETSS